MPRLLAALCVCLLFVGSASPAAADRWFTPPPVLGIVDAGRDAAAARQAGASWDRALFLWQRIQPNGPTDWTLDSYLAESNLGPTLSSGFPVVGVVQGTPGWAAGDYRDGASAVPTGLSYPVEDPRNTFGQFMLRLARIYKGRITTWVVWNEPDFLPGESGTWWTWSGNTKDFYSLLKTAYRAIKQVDPTATVVFPATTYFADAVHARELFLERVLAEANNDRDAPTAGYFFDAVGVNLYCSLDAVYKVYGVYEAILARYQLHKPLWLTETNCPVYNDASAPEPPSGRITTDEQAAYLIEAVALARAAGYARIGWYSMLDHDPSSGILDRWGLLRTDGTMRPAYYAFEVASQYLARPGINARLAPLGAPSANGWPVTRVVLDDPSRGSRVQVLWRDSEGPATVDVQADGTSATLIDPLGFSAAPDRTANGWEVALPPARTAQPTDPPGFQSVGYPILLVETGVSSEVRVEAPAVTSPSMALEPAVVRAAATLPVAPQPGSAVAQATAQPATAGAQPTAATAPPPLALLPATTTPGSSLVLSVGNPQPGDLLPRGNYVMQGQAFDRAANSGNGVDRVQVFLDDRDRGGQHVGDAVLGSPQSTGFTVTADLSRISGGHTLFVYARSSVSGKEAVVSFPVAVGNR